MQIYQKAKEIFMKNFYTGMIAGAAIGAVAGMLMDPISDKQAKSMKKTAKGIFSTMGNAIDCLMMR